MAARSPNAASYTPVTVTVRAALQSAAVKVSDAGLTVTASVLPVPSAPRASGVTVTLPSGAASSTTVQVASFSLTSAVAPSSVSATVTDTGVTVTAASSSVTATRTGATPVTPS